MLEPWRRPPDQPTRFRALAVRHGFDLEPALPDPAPATFDPEGALHPALLEPLSALPLQHYPTPAARAALVGRLLSEPGHPAPDDPADPFVAVYRFAARQDMEPEVTGTLALLLLRARIAKAARDHRQRLPDPEAALRDPDVDVFRGRRARLRDCDWEGLWAEVSAAASFVGTDPALGFERATLLSAARWLGDYRAWWGVAGHLLPGEEIPADTGPLRAALSAFDPDLGAAIAEGSEAEAAFMLETGSRPDGPVSARWLLDRQVRALRDIGSATRERSLLLHRLLRRCDEARVRVQLAWRACLLGLWLADDPEPLEERLLAIPGPPHGTTLGAGLGRLVGFVLLRRLRRGDERDALALADRALALAPEELAVRLTWNDLRFRSGPHDAALLRSLGQERGRWDSVSVSAMGARVSDAVGDLPAGRRFRDRLVERALALGTGSGWALAVAETLRDPAALRDRARLDRLAAEQKRTEGLLDPLSYVVFGNEDRRTASTDIEAALLGAIADLDAASGLEGAPLPAGVRRLPAWKQLLALPPVPPADPAFPGWLFGRIQGLRAAAPALRGPGLAGQLRGLCAELAMAADLCVQAPEDLGQLLPRLATWLLDPAPSGAGELAAWVEQARHPLRVAIRAPRAGRLATEIAALSARLRAAGRADLADRSLRLRPVLADPGSDLEVLDREIADLSRALDAPAAARPVPGLMRLHPDFEAFSVEDLGILPEALRRAREMVRLFNLSGGKRDRKRLRNTGQLALFELRHRAARLGGLRVFYVREGDGWVALAAMSKYDDRQQQEAIGRVLARFGG